MKHPEHWRRGQLLDLKRYTDGTYQALLLGEEPNEERDNVLAFPSSAEAQAFVSWWYADAKVVI